MWLCILTDRQFEETYENAQWIKARQMQAMWTCIFLCRPFEETFENAQCNQCDYALYRNVTYVTLHPPGQTIWGHIWKHTLEKSQTNATNVTMPLLGQAIRGHILRCTVKKSQTNATNGTMPALILVQWGNMWKTQWRSVIQMQPMWLCVFSCRWFEDTFKKAQCHCQWGKVKQMCLCTIFGKRVEETF